MTFLNMLCAKASVSIHYAEIWHSRLGTIGPLLTRDSARRITANVAKLPDFTGERHGKMVELNNRRPGVPGNPLSPVEEPPGWGSPVEADGPLKRQPNLSACGDENRGC